MATITYKGLSGIRGTLTVNTTDDLTTITNAIIADEGLTSAWYANFVLERNNSITLADNASDTYADLGLTGTDILVAILDDDPSTRTKEERQKMKLDLASVKRLADGNNRATYDITLLPTQYNDGDIINNPNTGGLVVGRPWINTTATFTFYEAFGTTEAISTTQYVSGNKIYAEASTYDVPDFQPARVVVNDIEVVNTELRGHTLVVLDTYGDVVTAATQYDTYIDSANLTALNSALNVVASGNIVVLVTYDASAFLGDVRPTLNTEYGSTNSDTWTAQRKSHIFIGIKQ